MFFNEFFYFRRTDRTLVCLLVVVACALLAIVLCIDGSSVSGNEVAGNNGKTVGIDTNNATSKTRNEAGDVTQTKLFRFDPNTADSLTLLRLGLQPWLVHNICRYRERGGVYSRAEDFARTYGLTVRQYRTLQPYIHISTDFLPASTLVGKSRTRPVWHEAQHTPDTIHTLHKMRLGETLALNTADTTALQRVPGIGSYFSRQIVTRRRMLGGFSSVEQLTEIDGFPLTALSYFTVDAAHVNRLNLNRLTLSQLRSHPYINFYQARAITDYRRLYGRLKGLETLRQLREFSEKDINRLAPYVEF